MRSSSSDVRRRTTSGASEPTSVRQAAANFYPVLPESWRLQGAEATTQQHTQEISGPIGVFLQKTNAVFKKVDGDLRKEADRQLVNSLRFLLKKIGAADQATTPAGHAPAPPTPTPPGATVLIALHDSAMPSGVHRMIDGIFLAVWPEIEKGILDGLVLDMGFQFDKCALR